MPSWDQLEEERPREQLHVLKDCHHWYIRINGMCMYVYACMCCVCVCACMRVCVCAHTCVCVSELTFHSTLNQDDHTRMLIILGCVPPSQSAGHPRWAQES